MKKQQKSITELLIELDQVNRRLDRPHNDPAYLAAKVREIFPEDKTQRKDYTEEIRTILREATR